MRIQLEALLGLMTAGLIRAHPHTTDCNSNSIPKSTALAAEDLPRDATTAPTAIKHFQELLVEKGALRTGKALENIIIFDFNHPEPAISAMGGALKAAWTAENYPFSASLGISITVGFLEPCSINTPHIHPRATEFLVLVEGSNVRFGSILENGLVQAGQNQEIAGTLRKLEGTVFPQGSIHWQFNEGCERAVIIASLNLNNLGTSQMAQNLFGLDAGIVNTTLGVLTTINDTSIEDFRKAIPVNLAQDVGACLARCRLQETL